MSIEARRAALDELVAAAPSRAVWDALWKLLLAWPEGEDRAAAIERADRGLGHWADADRHLLSDWAPLYAGDGVSEVARLVRSIELYRRSDQGTVELTRIAGSPHLAQLRRLRLVGCDLDSEAWLALAAAPHLRAVETLEVHHCDVMPEDLAAVLGSPVARTLRLLKLSRLGLRAPQLGELLGALLATGLRELDLSMNALGPKGVAALLAAGPVIAHLERLVLSGNPLGDDGRATLAKAPGLAGVRVVVDR